MLKKLLLVVNTTDWPYVKKHFLITTRQRRERISVWGMWDSVQCCWCHISMRGVSHIFIIHTLSLIIMVWTRTAVNVVPAESLMEYYLNHQHDLISQCLENWLSSECSDQDHPPLHSAVSDWSLLPHNIIFCSTFKHCLINWWSARNIW